MLKWVIPHFLPSAVVSADSGEQQKSEDPDD